MKQFILSEGSYIIEAITEKGGNVEPETEQIFKFKLTSQEIQTLMINMVLNLHGIEFCLKNEKLEITTNQIFGVVIKTDPNGNQYKIEEYTPKEHKRKYFLYNITDIGDK